MHTAPCARTNPAPSSRTRGTLTPAQRRPFQALLRCGSPARLRPSAHEAGRALPVPRQGRGSSQGARAPRLCRQGRRSRQRAQGACPPIGQGRRQLREFDRPKFAEVRRALARARDCSFPRFPKVPPSRARALSRSASVRCPDTLTLPVIPRRELAWTLLRAGEGHGLPLVTRARACFSRQAILDNCQWHSCARESGPAYFRKPQAVHARTRDDRNARERRAPGGSNLLKPRKSSIARARGSRCSSTNRLHYGGGPAPAPIRTQRARGLTRGNARQWP